MTYHYANPPVEARPAPSMVAPTAEAAVAAPLAGVNHWALSFVVAALLVAVLAGVVYLFAPRPDPLVVNMPAVAPVLTQAPLDVPSFVEFSGVSLPEPVQAGTQDKTKIGLAQHSAFLLISAGGSQWGCSVPTEERGCPGLMFACANVRGVNDVESDGTPSFLPAWFSLSLDVRQRMVDACAGGQP